MPSTDGLLDVKAKNFFLDTKLVEGLIGKKSAKSLHIALSRVRLRAMHSMRKKGRARRPPKHQGGKAFLRWQEEVTSSPVSAPGSPPFAHSENQVTSLRNIWFALDNTSATEVSGVVGPLRLNQYGTLNGVVTKGSVPRVHEKGGTARVQEWLFNVPGHKWRWVRGKGPRRGNIVRRTRIATYPPRPFMQPALTKESPKIAAIWGRSVA